MLDSSVGRADGEKLVMFDGKTSSGYCMFHVSSRSFCSDDADVYKCGVGVPCLLI